MDGDNFDEQLSRVNYFEEKILEYLEDESPTAYSEPELENEFETDFENEGDRYHFKDALRNLETDYDEVETLETAIQSFSPITPGSKHFKHQ